MPKAPWHVSQHLQRGEKKATNISSRAEIFVISTVSVSTNAAERFPFFILYLDLQWQVFQLFNAAIDDNTIVRQSED